MDISGLKDGNVAGFGIFQSPYAYIGVRKDGCVCRLVFCHDGKTSTILDRLDGHKVWIRVSTTDRDFTARFYYSLDGKAFTPIEEVLHMGLGYPWTANRFALFNYSESATGVDGEADFAWFRFYNK